MKNNKKNFQDWHKLKEKLDARKKRLFCNEREIWFCSLGINIGYEQDGKHNFFERPVIIFKMFNKEMFWGIPLTTKDKISKHHFSFIHKKRKQSIIISQLKLFDTKRLLRKMGYLSKKDFIKLKKYFKSII